MKPALEPLAVRILDHEYRLSCAPEEKSSLLAAVAYVDAQMSAIRDQGKIAGIERIAVFAALNIASELLAARTGGGGGASVAGEEFARRMEAINATLDAALATQEKLF